MLAKPSVVFLGSASPFSVVVLRRLLDAGIEVSTVLIPERAREPQSRFSSRGFEIPIYRTDDIADVCRLSDVRIERVKGLGDERTRARISTAEPDIVVSACFPFIAPLEVLELPRLGCLNLHPSLLPAYRGPAPLFWQYRAGEQTIGVTVHFMSDAIDAGDIIDQEEVSLTPGITASELNGRLAGIGGELLVSSIEALMGGEATRRPQEESASSYFSWPKEKDFEIDNDWPAERAFRFIRGTQEMGQVFKIKTANETLSVQSALLFSTHDTIEGSHERFGNDVRIQFSPGILHATLTET